MSAEDPNARLLRLGREGPPTEESLDPDARALWAAVAFRLGRRWFAVRASEVREVVVKGYVTRLPRAPAHLLGLTLVQGRLVPVVDLGLLTGEMEPGDASSMLPRLVLVAQGELEVGLCADEARGVLEIEEPRPRETDAAGSPVVWGETHWEGRLVSWLDAERLLAACRS